MRPSQRIAPVLLLIFNRPEPTRRVFEAIRQARPPRLYIAADGPRPGNQTDRRTCHEARLAASQIDWDCEVRTLMREENLGCGRAVSEALNWFFQAESAGIVLEDDCLPSSSFFGFCTEQLARYERDDRIMLVSGFNAQMTWGLDIYDRYQYFFSHLGGIWGWASWRRAWKHYDFEMRLLDDVLRSGALRDLLGDRLGSHRESQMLQARKGSLDTWAYQWGLARNTNSGLAIVPVRSLIENIGFEVDATHTRGNDRRARIARQDISLPTRENPIVIPDREYDERFFPKRWSKDRIRVAASRLLLHERPHP